MNNLNDLGEIIDYYFRDKREFISYREIIDAVEHLHGLALSVSDINVLMDSSNDFDRVSIKNPQSGCRTWHVHDKRTVLR